MAETWNKKEREKKKNQKKKEKIERLAENRENNKGKTMDDMIAYVDENGNLSDTPMDFTKVKNISLDDIVIGATKRDDTDVEETEGTVQFFNTEKGFGFITTKNTKESIFVHSSGLLMPIKENDQVEFKTQPGEKGLTAVEVKLIKK
jgi:cold shock CspA family protein